MTNKEFSDGFDTLVSSNVIVKPFGIDSSVLDFDEYEKSLFLTKAQETVVVSLYNGTLNGDPFEKTEELRRYLDSLIRTYSTDAKSDQNGITKDSYIFSIPEDVLFITYESVTSQDTDMGCLKGIDMEVVPVTQDELHKIRRNPFRGPNKRRVLRLDRNDHTVELISIFDIDRYQIRYISRPEPIILTDLPDGLTIGKSESFDGNKANECKLNPAVHRLILDMAVSLALKSRASAGK